MGGGQGFGESAARISVGEHEIAFVQRGHGAKNVVLLHGLGVDSSRWSAVLDPFACDSSVVAFDQVGFGRSSRPNRPLTIDVLVDTLTLFLDHLGMRQNVTLVGNSLGALVAARLATRSSNVGIVGLVLVGIAFVDGLAETADVPLMASRACPAPGQVPDYLDRVMHPQHRASVSTEDFATFRSIANDRASSESILHSLKGKPGLTEADIRAIRVPALVIHGDSDRIAPIARAQRLARELHDGRFLPFHTTGHWPQVERPTLFVEAVREFQASAAPTIEVSS
jgi:pimeloyl-ACP methyl ester carboxylesterase